MRPPVPRIHSRSRTSGGLDCPDQFGSWPAYARLVGGEVVAKKQELFAQAVGAGSWRVLGHHILPNIGSAIVVKYVSGDRFRDSDRRSASVHRDRREAADAGMGPAACDHVVQPAKLLVDRKFAELVILLTVDGINLLGEGLRDMLDPRDRVR
jgi:peptide/nickel transport system permease protein